MKLLLTTLVIGLLCQISFTQTATRSLSDFSSIDVSEGIHVELVKGNDPKAEITVENCNLSDVVTKVSGDELVVKFDRKFWGWKSNKKAWVTITYQQLDEIEVSSGGDIKSMETLSAVDMEIDASSGGRMDLTIEATSLFVDVSSGGVIEIKGKTNSQDVEVSSGGVYNAFDLESMEADVDASSGGNCRIFVTDNLDAEASSGGSVRYKGNPRNTSIDSNISASIRSS